ncbi:sugar ABC transporter permease [Sporanaerobium hydrogeniformans]|uniref:Sugar ABC transporter permease n=1 Tax=Sporanaerobium hydrogeniformans TaxID=3072179 RepID=A0AC61D9J2_9FIRM|nr:carbohydrate ABC transporter permease [Sporanaerobium hydrogeniformans]PHV69919.1 sugar ABC transporter permease [Sporanaerobium hydrogeniformans]
MTLKNQKMIYKVILMICLTMLACMYIYPVFLMFMNSFKPFGEIIANVLAFPSKLDLSNYIYVFNKMKYLRLFRNNVIITVIGIVGIIIFSSMAAYILDRRRGKYSSVAYALIITPMLIPFQTIMLTLLKSMNTLHLSGSKIGLGVQYWGFGIPMATFIFYNFMKTIPIEIDESAKIDGASTFTIYIKIIFPLLKSVTVTVIVLDVMWIWNDFLLPLLMVNTSNETKTLVLAAYTFIGQMNTKWNYALTAMVMAIVPSIIIFILLQKYIVEGVVAGAVKG